MRLVYPWILVARAGDGAGSRAITWASVRGGHSRSCGVQGWLSGETEIFLLDRIYVRMSEHRSFLRE